MKKKLISIIAVVVAFLSSTSIAFAKETHEIIDISTDFPDECINLVEYYEQHPEILKERTQSITDAKLMATVVDSIAPDSDDYCKTAIMECIKNRVRSTGFPNSIEDVCSQKNQWQGYSSQSVYTDQTYKLAKDFIDNLNTYRISPINRDMVYMRIENSGIYFRNSWDSENEIYIPFYSC